MRNSQSQTLTNPTSFSEHGLLCLLIFGKHAEVQRSPRAISKLHNLWLAKSNLRLRCTVSQEMNEALPSSRGWQAMVILRPGMKDDLTCSVLFKGF